MAEVLRLNFVLMILSWLDLHLLQKQTVRGEDSGRSRLGRSRGVKSILPKKASLHELSSSGEEFELESDENDESALDFFDWKAFWRIVWPVEGSQRTCWKNDEENDNLIIRIRADHVLPKMSCYNERTSHPTGMMTEI